MIFNLSLYSQTIQVDCDEKDCGGLCYKFTSPYGPEVFQEWDFGDGTSMSCFCSVVEHCYTNVNTYANINGTTTVTLTVPGIGQWTSNLTHANCQQGIFIGNTDGSVSTLSNFTALPGNSFTGSGLMDQVYVYGRVNVNKNFIFTSTQITVSPGGGFNVLFHRSFSLLQSTKVDVAEKCPCMWRGIDVQSGAVLNTARSTLRHALYAVRAFTNASVLHNLSLFYDNYIGLMGVGNFIIPDNANAFSANTFSVTDGLKDWCNPEVVADPFAPSGGQFSQQAGWAGVYLENVDNYRIPATTAVVNTFNSLHNGFYMVNSNARAIVSGQTQPGIRMCRFTTMLRGAYPANLGGHGIYFLDTEGSHFLNQQGLGQTLVGSPTFDRCEVGIYAEAIGGAGGSSVTSRQNLMSNVETGIRIQSVTGNITSTLTDNVIRSEVDFGHDLEGSAGIWLEDKNTDLTTHLVENNRITVNQPVPKPGFGIILRGNYDMIPDANNVIIRNNPDITVQAGRSCIHVTQYHLVDIYNNLLNAQLPSGGGLYGVYMGGGFQNLIHCNIITGPTATGVSIPTIDAMRYNASVDNVIYDNLTVNFEKGTAFQGICGMNVDLRCNHFAGIQSHGLFYNTTSMTGLQVDHGNTWEGSYLNFAALHQPNNPNQSNNRYWARPGTIEFPPNVTPVSDWFNNSSIIPQCPADPNCNSFLAGEILNYGDSIIADGGIGGTGGMMWSAEKYLYTKLKDNPSLLSGNALMQSFVDARENTPMGQFYEIGKGVQSLYEIESSIKATLDANTAAIQLGIEQMQAIDAVLPEDPSTSQYETLLEDRQDLLDNILTKSLENEAIYTALHDARVQAAENLLADNAAITATELFELNEQQFFDIFLNTVGKDNAQADQAQLQALEDMALQCPEEGGRAVHWAIGLYGNLTSTTIEAQECEIGLREGGQQKIEVNAFTLSPNPTSGTCRVEFRLETGSTGEFVVLDQTGRMAAKYPLTSQTGTFELYNLPAGIYFVQLRLDGGFHKVEKLVKF